MSSHTRTHLWRCWHSTQMWFITIALPHPRSPSHLLTVYWPSGKPGGTQPATVTISQQQTVCPLAPGMTNMAGGCSQWVNTLWPTRLMGNMALCWHRLGLELAKQDQGFWGGPLQQLKIMNSVLNHMNYTFREKNTSIQNISLRRWCILFN